MLCRIIAIALTITIATNSFAMAQDTSSEAYFNKFLKSYNKGDLPEAEKHLRDILKQGNALSNSYRIAVYNNLGVIYFQMGRYNEALEYHKLAEESITNRQQSAEELADIYINISRIYGIIKEYDKAIDYAIQGIKLYKGLTINNNVLFKISTANINLGITLYKIKNYKKALHHFSESLRLKTKYSLPEKSLVYLNIAKVAFDTGDTCKADSYFRLSIEWFNREFGQDHYRITSVLNDYGEFLRLTGRSQKALEMHKKSLTICLNTYGDKHPYVSLAYKTLGDFFAEQSDYKTALHYYQKSLIAIVPEFNNKCIFADPPIKSAIFNYRLLDNLKSKAFALMMHSHQQAGVFQVKLMKQSFQTMELALQVIEQIRETYSSHDSKLYLAENEKDTYLQAIEIARELYSLTKESKYIESMYSISSISKSRVLHDEYNENETLYGQHSSDSILARRNELRLQISSYNKLIQDEQQKAKPDSQKIELWTDKLFEVNRNSEMISEKIKKMSSQNSEIQDRVKPTTLKKIQAKLKTDESIVEYFLPHNYTQSQRQLYTFVITKSTINYHSTPLDSIFVHNVSIIKHAATNHSLNNASASYKKYLAALHYMYSVLIKPIENKLAGSKITIIPDEEISYLPFDAFIREIPQGATLGFDGLRYLIHNYSISYAYSSSLIFEQNRVKTQRILLIAPHYTNQSDNNSPIVLEGAKSEAQTILHGLIGNCESIGISTEKDFKQNLDSPAIIHLAMHSSTDTINPKYSSLIFDTPTDSTEDGKLYSYEIAMNRMESPLVVLSACNTGSGALYHGEGIMSLARSFFLSGASAVINTLWDVNDEASAPIMTEFYRNLDLGSTKDEAMRQAKLKYIKNSPPTYANPYYWAAYQVMGDKSPIKQSNGIRWIAILTLSAIAITGILYYYKMKLKKV